MTKKVEPNPGCPWEPPVILGDVNLAGDVVLDGERRLEARTQKGESIMSEERLTFTLPGIHRITSDVNPWYEGSDKVERLRERAEILDLAAHIKSTAADAQGGKSDMTNEERRCILSFMKSARTSIADLGNHMKLTEELPPWFKGNLEDMSDQIQRLQDLLTNSWKEKA